jgi:predicted DNA repair protein MutK
MSSGLAALLDDVAAIAKLAATSLDDASAAAGKAGAKAAGVVVDDAAVTPRYVVGLSPARELPIIWKIAKGSLRNKLLILLPAALLLSAFLPWAITPILMLGGAYLAFEGAEKLMEAFGGGHHAEVEEAVGDPATLEDTKVAGAIRTDLILSAEIMAISLADVADRPILTQGFVLGIVGLAVTVGVYGVVGLIVKVDDVGLHLAQGRSGALRALGRGLVKAMPPVMTFISTVGTAAMLWVGGGILIHGARTYGLVWPEDVIHDAAVAVASALPFGGPVVEWLVTALGAAIVGILVGGVLAVVVHQISRLRHKPAADSAAGH